MFCCICSGVKGFSSSVFAPIFFSIVPDNVLCNLDIISGLFLAIPSNPIFFVSALVAWNDAALAPTININLISGSIFVPGPLYFSYNSPKTSS